MELVTEVVRQGKSNLQAQSKALELLESALAIGFPGSSSGSVRALQAASPGFLAGPPPAASVAVRRLVYVHGICAHAQGFSNPWWKALQPFVGQVFGSGALGQSRQEVLWSDLVNEVAALAAAVAPSNEMFEQAQVAEEIRQVMEDRFERHAIAVGQPTTDGIAPLSAARSLISIPGLNCIDDFSVYLVNDSVRQSIIDRFTQVVRPLLINGLEIDVVSHSWGTVVAYEGLRELEATLATPLVRNFFTVGAALSIGPVKQRLRAANQDGRRPKMVRRWVNLNAHGDLVGGPLKGRPYEVDDDLPNLVPFGCGSLLGLVNPVCAHGSYFQVGNLATNRDIFGKNINAS